MTKRLGRLVMQRTTQLRYDRRTQTDVLKWKTEQGASERSLLTTSLVEPTVAALAEAYDDRAAIEAETKAGKGGLQLRRRCKRRQWSFRSGGCHTGALRG
jgi:hypothetical protein